MSYNAIQMPFLGLDGYTGTNKTSTGFRVGEFIQGILFIHITTLGGSTPRVTPRYDVGVGTGPSTARYALMKTYGTGIKATGLAIMTLGFVGRFGRCSYSVGGTGALATMSVTFEGKGAYG